MNLNVISKTILLLTTLSVSAFAQSTGTGTGGKTRDTHSRNPQLIANADLVCSDPLISSAKARYQTAFNTAWNSESIIYLEREAGKEFLGSLSREELEIIDLYRKHNQGSKNLIHDMLYKRARKLRSENESAWYAQNCSYTPRTTNCKALAKKSSLFEFMGFEISKDRDIILSLGLDDADDVRMPIWTLAQLSGDAKANEASLDTGSRQILDKKVTAILLNKDSLDKNDAIFDTERDYLIKGERIPAECLDGKNSKALATIADEMKGSKQLREERRGDFYENANRVQLGVEVF